MKNDSWWDWVKKIVTKLSGGCARVKTQGQDQRMINHNLQQLPSKFIKHRREGNILYNLYNYPVDPILKAVENYAEKFCGNVSNSPSKSEAF